MLLESHATDQMVSRRERRHIFESLKVKDRPRQVCAKSQRRDAILKFGSVISAGEVSYSMQASKKQVFPILSIVFSISPACLHKVILLNAGLH